MKTIMFYTTEGCHLCEQAWKIVAPLAQQFSFQLRSIEISEDEGLVEALGTRIPVIRLDGMQQDLGWPFDDQDIIEYLSE